MQLRNYQLSNTLGDLRRKSAFRKIFTGNHPFNKLVVDALLFFDNNNFIRTLRLRFLMKQEQVRDKFGLRVTKYVFSLIAYFQIFVILLS